MRARILSLSLLLAVAGSAARPVAAQSLADVARKEGERRKDVKEPVKTFTNKDLPNAPAPSSSTAPSAPVAAAQPEPADRKDTTASKDQAASGADKSKDQKYWAEGIKSRRDKLEKDKVLADAMQTRINALTTDFVNRDDPAQRSVIDQNRQKALEQLAALKQALIDDAKAIEDFEEQARKAGVPPGWLR